MPSVSSFDSSVPHGGGSTHTSPLDCEGDFLVAGHALSAGAEVRLHLLKHLLLGIELGIWGAWKEGSRAEEQQTVSNDVCVCLTVCVCVCV